MTRVTPMIGFYGSQQRRQPSMGDLPMKPHIENAPPDPPKRKRGPSNATRRRAVKSQPRDRAGRFAEKPGIFTRMFDGVEKVQRIAKRGRRPQKPARYTKRRRRVRRAVSAPQPNYRQHVRKNLWNRVTGLFRGKRA